MKTLTIPGIDPELSGVIKELASQKNVSVNKLLLKALKNFTGLSQNTVFETYNDLDYLAGGWSEKDENFFLDQTKYFRKIDGNMWK